MGNEFGQPTSKLGITSIASTTPNIERNEVDKLYRLLNDAQSQSESLEILSRDTLDSCLKQMEKFTPSDTELFVQLFTLFDNEGHDTVDFKSFVTGSCICLISESAVNKLKWGLSVFESRTDCARGDVKKLLLAINLTAAFFGDPVLPTNEIDLLTVELFKEVPSVAGRISQEECVAYLLKHPLVIQFLTGQGIVKFGAPDLQL
jgi:Ca2+-binding EF-hand superfamily protein